MLIVISFLCLSIALAMQSIPPILTLIIEDLGISHAEAGLFSAIVNLPGIFLLIPLSFISTRFGNKLIGLIVSSMIIIGSIIIFFAQNFMVLLLGRIIIGIGASALIIVGLQSITQWFTGRRIGLALGIYSATLPLAIIIAMNSFGAAGLAWGWRSAILITIIITLFAFVVYAIFYKPPPVDIQGDGYGGKLSPKSLFTTGWKIWALALAWGFFTMSMFSVTTFMPDFLYQHGTDLRVAGSITSIIMAISMVLSPVIGHLLDITKNKELYGIVCALGCCIVLFILPQAVNLIVVFMVLYGIFTTPFSTLTFAMVPMVLKKEMISIGYGITATVSYAGMLVGPWITGSILDLTDSYTYIYWYAGLFFIFIVGIYVLLMVKRKRAAIHIK